jgi:hypothetical protein
MLIGMIMYTPTSSNDEMKSMQERLIKLNKILTEEDEDRQAHKQAMKEAAKEMLTRAEQAFNHGTIEGKMNGKVYRWMAEQLMDSI